MADYHSPTVIQQKIPVAEMTSLEYLLLTNIFDAETHDDTLYLSAYESPGALIWVDRAELETAIAAEENKIYPVSEVIDQLKSIPLSERTVMFDVSASPTWEEMLHNIVRRSSTLKYLSVVTSYTCSKMRPDGWGGVRYPDYPDDDQRQGY